MKSHAFIHGDLKPENVIVTPDARPVLSDFGLARQSGLGRIETGVAGTPFHISPEELLGLEGVSKRSMGRSPTGVRFGLS